MTERRWLVSVIVLLALILISREFDYTLPMKASEAETPPNIISGYSGNNVREGVVGGAISGGGNRGFPNVVTADFGTISGGLGNEAAAQAVVGGGYNNTTTAYRATIGGGFANLAIGGSSTIGGGERNSANLAYTTVSGGSFNTANGLSATVGGGTANIADGPQSTVGGGTQNAANGFESTVSGGTRNTATNAYAAIGGGLNNQAIGRRSAIAGGAGNIAAGEDATIGGGLSNQATDRYSTVAGGRANRAGNGNDTMEDARYATVGGGQDNVAAGLGATVGGGQENVAGGDFAGIAAGSENVAAGDYSFAVGRRAQIDAGHDGALLLADATDADFVSEAANEFAVRATGGVRLITAVADNGRPLAGVQLAEGSGSWQTLSDRHAKANIVPVNELEILTLLMGVPISTWNYQTQDAGIRHIGPMAQDFYAAFGVGEDERYLTAVDTDGVALAAIQGLYGLIQSQETQITGQQQQIEQLAADNATLTERVSALEARLLALEQSLSEIR